ncbi:MAG: GtrA family protein [Prevotella sp.]|nr:GtrA family protein [Bacteroides sp.]MCM1366002.1 GtrA family protein [Prevotella sp.]MCM1436928.1 GtrA family protein [Prevotella sp.]
MSNKNTAPSAQTGDSKKDRKSVEIKDRLLNSDNWFFEFLRSVVSSQAASWLDMGCRFVFFTFVFASMGDFYRSNLSVAIGALVGGIVNCSINYKFTFHASGQNVRAVAVKYILVWTGSLLLNMYGTTFATFALSRAEWVKHLDIEPEIVFSAATLLVSLLVSWFWNFVLQRNFVYRPFKWDKYFIKITYWIIPKKRLKTEPEQ